MRSLRDPIYFVDIGWPGMNLIHLQELADRLNELDTNRNLPVRYRKAWELARAVATCMVPDPRLEISTRASGQVDGELPTAESFTKAIEMFHSSFKRPAVLLHVDGDMTNAGLEFTIGAKLPGRWESSSDGAAAMLWAYFFFGSGWKRLKRCQVCAAWIVAKAKNKIVRFCPKCDRWKYWSYERRLHSPNFRRRQSRTKRL